MAVHDLQIKVVDCKGLCPVGHKPGDVFSISQGLAMGPALRSSSIPLSDPFCVNCELVCQGLRRPQRDR